MFVATGRRRHRQIGAEVFRQGIMRSWDHGKPHAPNTTYKKYEAGRCVSWGYSLKPEKFHGWGSALAQGMRDTLPDEMLVDARGLRTVPGALRTPLHLSTFRYVCGLR
eukprot:52853-Chlamydomonas_euryale.AAC.9